MGTTKFKWGVFSAIFGVALLGNASAAEPVPSDELRLQVKRHLVSRDRNIWLDIYTGTWKSHGLMQIRDERFVTSFEGFQRGTKLDLKSYDAERGLEAPPLFSIEGDLDVMKATMTAKITDNRSGVVRNVTLVPPFPIKDRPTFTFKFLGYHDAAAYRWHVTQIQVIDKNTKQVVQTLSGFDAMPLASYYEDINFDGYFDLRMSANSWNESIANENYLYWLYDPSTKRFKRSAQYEAQPGFLDTSFWCKELRFYGPNNFNYIDGKMVPARNTFCRPWD